MQIRYNYFNWLSLKFIIAHYFKNPIHALTKKVYQVQLDNWELVEYSEFFLHLLNSSLSSLCWVSVKHWYNPDHPQITPCLHGDERKTEHDRYTEGSSQMAWLKTHAADEI